MDIFKSVKGWFAKPEWNPAMCKVHLKLAASRIKLQATKKLNVTKILRKEISALLKEGKETQARVRVENLVRELNIIDAIAQLEIVLDHFLARFDAMNLTSHPPPDLQGPICTVVFAAPRLDVQELRQISENLKLKYGPEFIADAMANRYHTVNEKVVAKLTMSRPPKAIVDSFLVEIAAEYNVDWQPADGIVTMSDSLGSPAPPEVPDMVDVPEEPNFGEEDLMVLEPPEEEPNALSQEDAEMMNDPDLLRELEEFQPIASHLPAKTVPDVPIPDFGDDDDIIFPTPPSSTGVVPSKPTNQFTPPKPAATKTPTKPTKPISPTNNLSQQQQDDDFELDFPTIPSNLPKTHFGGGGDDGDGGDLGNSDDDLLSSLPHVPPTTPGAGGGNSSSRFGGGDDFGNNTATLARKPSSHRSPGPAPGSADLPDDDDLLARFRKLQEN